MTRTEDSKAQDWQRVHDEMLADCLASLADASAYLRGAHLSKEEAATVQSAALNVRNWAMMALYRAQKKGSTDE